MLLLALCAVTQRFFAPDEGDNATTGLGEQSSGTSVEKDAKENAGKDVQDIAKENAELVERATELGIEIPNFPGTPAGIEACRSKLRELIKQKEENPDEEEEGEKPEDDGGEVPAED